MDWIEIDGSAGEGGGQVLRTALSLSLLTRRPFRISGIRSGRTKPGLMRQHLACVQAAAEIGGAEVTGDTLGSSMLAFIPGAIRAGDYEFAIATAGSSTLLLQTILPPLMSCGVPSRIIVKGGTHNPHAPPFDFLSKTFLPAIARCGFKAEAELKRPGFYPAGGGEIAVNVGPREPGRALSLVERGVRIRSLARILFSALPFHIVEREKRTIEEGRTPLSEEVRIEERKDSNGPGNAVLIEVESEQITEVFTAFGERGRSAEKVAQEADGQALRYLASEAAAGQHLADQLLLYVALLGSGEFTTLRPSLHTLTNMDIIGRFIEAQFKRKQLADDCWLIQLGS